jgi:hypothetical protein
MKIIVFTVVFVAHVFAYGASSTAASENVQPGASFLQDLAKKVEAFNRADVKSLSIADIEKEQAEIIALAQQMVTQAPHLADLSMSALDADYVMLMGTAIAKRRKSLDQALKDKRRQAIVAASQVQV